MVDFEARGIPYGRAAEVNLKNNHAQYIFTWYIQNAKPRSRLSLLANSSKQVQLGCGHLHHALHGHQEAFIRNSPSCQTQQRSVVKQKQLIIPTVPSSYKH
jgi:hypothetical protein